MNDSMKKVAVSGSAIVLAIIMGLQTFVFGQSEIQTLKQEVSQLSERLAKLEVSKAHE